VRTGERAADGAAVFFVLSFFMGEIEKMKTGYVLIDYENVQPKNIDILDAPHFKIIVFVGAKQKIDIATVAALHGMGERVKYVQITQVGKNALDLCLAKHLGQIVKQEPEACFHIISKDTDYDLLVTYLKGQNISVHRVIDVSEIAMAKAKPSSTPTVKAKLSSTLDERLDVIVADMRKRGASRPRKVATLRSTIHALFQKTLSDTDLDNLMSTLEQKGIINISDSAVTYSLPAKQV
jgi:septum formation topological specificity factor MinE